MRVSLTVAQFPITWDVKRNVELISEVLAEARPDDIVVLPEGALSGYGPDLSVLGDLDTLALAHATDRVADLAQQKAVHLFCGTLLFDQESGATPPSTSHPTAQGGSTGRSTWR